MLHTPSIYYGRTNFDLLGVWLFKNAKINKRAFHSEAHDLIEYLHIAYV